MHAPMMLLEGAHPPIITACTRSLVPVERQLISSLITVLAYLQRTVTSRHVTSLFFPFRLQQTVCA